jgi:hypothetical protein
MIGQAAMEASMKFIRRLGDETNTSNRDGCGSSGVTGVDRSGLVLAVTHERWDATGLGAVGALMA